MRRLSTCLSILFCFGLAPAAAVAQEPASVDLSLGKRISDFREASVEQGEILTFELVYANEGSVSAEQVVIEDFYNRNSWLQILQKPDLCVDDGQKLVCSLGEVAAGEEGILAYAARVTFTAEPQEYTALAVISARQADADTSNNSGRISLRVTEPPRGRSPTPTSTTTLGDIEPVTRTPQPAPTPTAIRTEDETLDPEKIALTAEATVAPESEALSVGLFTSQPAAGIGEEVAIVITIANTSGAKLEDIAATVAFPFESFDLLSANLPYSYRGDDGTLRFTKPQLARGGRWVIRLNARAVQSAEVRYPHRADLSVEVTGAEAAQTAASVIGVTDEPAPTTREDQAPPAPRTPTPQPQATAASGPLVAWLLAASMIGAGVMRRRAIRR